MWFYKRNHKNKWLLHFCKKNIYIPRIKNCIFILYLFRSLALTIIVITMVQCFKFLSNKMLPISIHINGHNTIAPPLTFHMNYSSIELVLFEKLPHIKLSRSIVRVTTFLQFSSTISSLNILLQYTQGLEENIKILNTRLVTNNETRKHMRPPKETYLMHPSWLHAHKQWITINAKS